MAEIFHAFNMRSLNGSIFTMNKQNAWLWGAGLVSFLLTTAVVEIDFFANAFELAHLDLTEYAIAMGLAILVIPVVEIIKLITRLVHKTQNR
jgi:Ca2+-transporting ATPase